MPEDRLNTLIERIVNLDYKSMEELINRSDSNQLEEIRTFLDRIIVA